MALLAISRPIHPSGMRFESEVLVLAADDLGGHDCGLKFYAIAELLLGLN